MKANGKPNALYFGDNLDVLRQHIKDESVDLIYLDPPFNSQQDYNVIYRDKTGQRSEAQRRAFEDTWEWGDKAQRAFEELVKTGGHVGRTVEALYKILGNNDMMAYLCMMAPRLVELHRVLKPTGNLYLHCDPTASHYLKVLMDAVLERRFLNEIIWHYRKWPAGTYTFQRNHDILLFYAKTDSKKRTFNQLFMDRAPSTLKRFGKAKIISGHDDKGRRVPSQMADEESGGVRMDDVWDIGRVPPIKQLFPTQKPDPLLERILQASSNPGDVVLDPFCGCGTTVAAAHRLGRRWIGIDVTYLALTVIEERLLREFGGVTPVSRRAVRDTWTLGGVPQEAPALHRLAHENPYGFQDCVMYYLKGRPLRDEERRRGGDEGIDGELVFFEGKGVKASSRRVLVSVKGGQQVNPGWVRDLRGTLDRERKRGAEIGCLVTATPPTAGMEREAASAGIYQSSTWGRRGPYPRLQVVQCDKVLAAWKSENGYKALRYPWWADITWPEALRGPEDKGEQLEVSL